MRLRFFKKIFSQREKHVAGIVCEKGTIADDRNCFKYDLAWRSLVRCEPARRDCCHFASEELFYSIDATFFLSICKMSQTDIVTKGVARVKEIDKVCTPISGHGRGWKQSLTMWHSFHGVWSYFCFAELKSAMIAGAYEHWLISPNPSVCTFDICKACSVYN